MNNHSSEWLGVQQMGSYLKVEDMDWTWDTNWDQLVKMWKATIRPCGECTKLKEMPEDDYLCPSCRQGIL